MLSLWNNHAGSSYTDYTGGKLGNERILSVNNSNNNSNNSSKENELVLSHREGYAEHAVYTRTKLGN